MREMPVAVLVFALLLVASLSTLFFVPRLPPRHRSDETHAVVKLAAGIFILMASLLLGLLVNTAKNTFEGVDRNVHAFATELVLLDRALRNMGPDAAETRQRLHAYTQRALDGTWPAAGAPTVDDREAERLLNQVETSLHAIPQKPERADLFRNAQQNLQTIVRLRWVLIDGANGTLYMPLFVMLVGWLVLIFASVGFNAPANPVVVATLVASAFVITTSLYFVLDMDRPFEGPVRISPAPMHQALDAMRR
jgi:hypothetical protein